MEENKNYEKLDLSKLNYSQKEMTTEEALADIEPIKWTDDVLNGERKIVVSKMEDKK